jgi:hypothetical protein
MKIRGFVINGSLKQKATDKQYSGTEAEIDISAEELEKQLKEQGYGYWLEPKAPPNNKEWQKEKQKKN